MYHGLCRRRRSRAGDDSAWRAGQTSGKNTRRFLQNLHDTITKKDMEPIPNKGMSVGKLVGDGVAISR